MPPALIFLSVAMDEILKPVETEIICANKIMTRALIRPAWPTTHPRRIYMITPKIVKMEGVNTPAKVPNFLGLAGICLKGVGLALVINLDYSLFKLLKR